MSERYIVIHGHFYQPPRENPWIEETELQDSAAPYHDWNERIIAECYGPNSAARIVGASGGVIGILNNYAKISFNVGPTLLAWLERWAPSTYQKILEADRASMKERGGHGNAIAQAYNHVILPLATKRDAVTEIRWGIADFKRRFGRMPQGMWLPECAVDEGTLCLLCDEGIAFTVLGPKQARRFRSMSSSDWHHGIDPRRAYLCELPGGRSIVLFFYDAGVAHDIAFGQALADRDALVGRLLSAFGDAGTSPGAGPWLVNVATDGETFGHHRPFGDMVLAAAIERLEREHHATLTNYAQFLALNPPTHAVDLVTPSSWSCAHGLGRWRDDCGCVTNARLGWHQRWRRPLRDALDDLSERLAELFARCAAPLLASPWEARDAYIRVILDRSPGAVDSFLDEHSTRPLLEHERVIVLKLLEMQRHALLMYTSCGWFFGELSGPEGVQNLKYAARAIQLAREIDGTNLEASFRAALARAPSNILDGQRPMDGRRVLDQWVRPSVVNLGRVVAHYAISSLFEHYPRRGRIFCYLYEADDWARKSRGPTTLAIGRVRLSSEITREATHASFAALHFGGHDVRCAIMSLSDLPIYEDLKSDLLALFERRSIGDVVRAIDRHFAGRDYALSDLFLDERRKILRVLVADILARHHSQLFEAFEENRPLLRFLVEADTPVPGPLRAAADYALSMRQVELLAEARLGSSRFEAARSELVHLKEEARALGVSLDLTEAKRILEARILDEARSLSTSPRRETARALHSYLEMAEELGLAPNLWEVQNHYWTLALDGSRQPDLDVDLLFRLGCKLGFDEEGLEHALSVPGKLVPGVA
ncbi:MAG: DUF3536 domain-containing protein [Deltaproteobacteria bacterium]|nr:DUF3536 domain-containing protein [Deltaproteobacteria bacterium]